MMLALSRGGGHAKAARRAARWVGSACRNRETTNGQGHVMHTFRCVRLSVLVASLLVLGLGACSRTWEGLKEDTGENLRTTGQSLEKAGEDIKKQAQ